MPPLPALFFPSTTTLLPSQPKARGALRKGARPLQHFALLQRTYVSKQRRNTFYTWAKANLHLILPITNIPSPPSQNYPLAPLLKPLPHPSIHLPVYITFSSLLYYLKPRTAERQTPDSEGESHPSPVCVSVSPFLSLLSLSLSQKRKSAVDSRYLVLMRSPFLA